LPLDAAASDAVRVELHSGPRREVALTLGDGLSAVLRDDDPVIELSVAGGKATVTIDRDGAVTVASRRGIALQGGEIRVEGDAITVRAAGELNLKGATVNIN
jgi:hypothetical protein